MAEALMSRAGAILAVCAAVALIVLAAWFNHDRARRATARAAAAERQAEMNAEATRQLDRYATTTTIIREKAQEAENAVRSAPGADAPLDPDNRRVLCTELERVRGTPVCAPPGP